MTYKGFTLIEVLIVLALSVILFSISLPLYDSLLRISALDSGKTDVMEQLRLAQTKAKYGEQNSRFGVYLQAASYTLFQGNTFANRVIAADRVFSLPTNISTVTNTEIVFATSTGLPAASSTIILINNTTNRTETIIINEQGLIE